MQLTKPLPQRVRVVISDAEGRTKSESLTIYNATPVEVRGELQKLIAGREAHSTPPLTVSSALAVAG